MRLITLTALPRASRPGCFPGPASKMWLFAGRLRQALQIHPHPPDSAHDSIRFPDLIR